MIQKETQTLEKLVEEAKELDPIRRFLVDYRQRQQSLPESYRSIVDSLREKAVVEDDELRAKAVWCLETIGAAQDYFTKAFDQLRSDKFYGGWCTLERCEVLLRHLRQHYHPIHDSFGIDHMERHLVRIQDLFPYVCFFSPAYLALEAECSVCTARMTLRGGCEHRIGEIYAGRACHRIIKNMEVSEISIVTNPAQKYSVAFAGGFNYGAVHYTISGLRSPWSRWSYDRSKIKTDNELYPSTGRNDPCPCGSEKKYKRCCIGKKGMKEHVRVHFEEAPDSDLPRYLDDAAYWVADEVPAVGATSQGDAA